MTTRARTRKVALIHTTPLVEEVFRSIAEDFPALDLEHVTDASLFDRATSTPGLEFDRCVLELCRKADKAAASGAEAIVVTCSTLGPATDVVNAVSPMPVVRIDRPMAVEAAGQGDSIGLIATQESNLEASIRMLQEAARQRGKERIGIRTILCTEAFDALKNNDPDLHDRLVGQRIDELAPEVEAVVLAQASMTSAAAHPRSVPVLTSPAAALRHAGAAAEAGPDTPVPLTKPDLDQLRIYRIREGLMDIWLEYFDRVIAPLHLAVGIPIRQTWRNTTDKREFVWIRSFSADQTVEEQENRFFTSPARAALGDVRERYVEHLAVRVLRPA